MGQVYLTGRDQDIWKDGTDLVTLKPWERPYPFVGWLNKLLPTYHATIGRHHKVKLPFRSILKGVEYMLQKLLADDKPYPCVAY